MSAIKRCKWCASITDKEYLQYHDEERALFELLCLEGAQAGLSWITILKKRKNYRKSFCHFDLNSLITQVSKAKIASILDSGGVVKHRGKIESVFTNAGAAKDVVREFGSLHAFFLRRSLEGVDCSDRSEHNSSICKRLFGQNFKRLEKARISVCWSHSYPGEWVVQSSRFWLF